MRTIFVFVDLPVPGLVSFLFMYFLLDFVMMWPQPSRCIARLLYINIAGRKRISTKKKKKIFVGKMKSAYGLNRTRLIPHTFVDGGVSIL
jgi:hypothetical protein